MTSEALIKKAKRFKIAKSFLVIGSFVLALGTLGAGLILRDVGNNKREEVLNEFSQSREYQEQILEDFNELKEKFDGNDVLANEYINSLKKDTKDNYIEACIKKSNNAILKGKYAEAEEAKGTSKILMICSIPAMVGYAASLFYVQTKEEKYEGILDTYLDAYTNYDDELDY